MSTKKPKSILLKLPEEQQAQLAEWLLSGMQYHQAKELLEKEFGVRFSSLSVFKPFWEEVCTPALLARRHRAVMTAEEVAKSAEAQPGKLDQATIAALKQKAFELAISPGQDPEAVKAVFSLVLKARDQDLDAENLKLQRDRFEFDAAKRAMEEAARIKTISADSSLDSDGKIQRVRQLLFGISTTAEAAK
jgi:hypothetical protein